jgi:Integrase zinc binding domain
MRAAHDSLGHRGFYATKELLGLRFWWPEYERDVSWYIRTCDLCQERQKALVRIPPVITHTPSIFQEIHTDVMIMGELSNGHHQAVAARDSLSRWVEGRPLKSDTAQALGMFLLEDIICRWGCPARIITDNAKQFKAAVSWLKEKYGIQNIQISPYNSKANGKVENGHWSMRQSLYKATGGNPKKWYYFFLQVLWADRITIRKGLGCSPFFMVTGAHPLIPLDIEEATWLVDLPGRVLTDSELIGYRAQALAKHSDHVEAMRQRVDQEKRVAVRKYEEYHKHTIINYDFKPGRLVLVRNTRVENSL